MPITFNPLYTGQNSAAKMPDLDNLERAQQNLMGMQVKGAEQGVQKKREEQADYMKLMSIDPVQGISQRNADVQAKLLDSYNNDVAKLYMEGNGFANELEVARKRNILRAQQSKMVSDEKAFQNAWDLFHKDTRGYYDPAKFQKGYEDYVKTGNLSPDILSVNAQDPRSILANLKGGTRTQPELKRIPIKDANGNVVDYKDTSVTYDSSPEEAKNSIVFHSQTNLPFFLGLLKRFDNSPDAQKYLEKYDPQGQLKTDPAEDPYQYQHLDWERNPVIQWAINNDELVDAARHPQYSTPTNIPKKDSEVNINISSTGTGVKYTPNSANTKPIGNTTFTEYHDIPDWNKIIRITPSNMTILEPDKKKDTPDAPKTNIVAIPTGYDEATDSFTFAVSKDFKDIDYNALASGNGMQISVKRSDLGAKEFFNNLEIVKGGKKVKIGTLGGSQNQTTTTPAKGTSGIKWK